MMDLKIDLRSLTGDKRIAAATAVQKKAFSQGLQYHTEGKRIQHLDSSFFYLDYSDGLIREGGYDSNLLLLQK